MDRFDRRGDARARDGRRPRASDARAARRRQPGRCGAISAAAGRGDAGEAARRGRRGDGESGRRRKRDRPRAATGAGARPGDRRSPGRRRRGGGGAASGSCAAGSRLRRPDGPASARTQAARRAPDVAARDGATQAFVAGDRRARRKRAGAPARGAVELAAYRNALLAKISGAARYPEAARERGATGVATVRFALDGGGAVTLADLAQSSGDRALDDEALAAVRRASPLPPPPADAPRAYSAPIRFELR